MLRSCSQIITPFNQPLHPVSLQRKIVSLSIAYLSGRLSIYLPIYIYIYIYISMYLCMSYQHNSISLFYLSFYLITSSSTNYLSGKMSYSIIIPYSHQTSLHYFEGGNCAFFMCHTVISNYRWLFSWLHSLIRLGWWVSYNR